MIDIIIPTYNNVEGLKRTLQSIPQRGDLNITIVDDCSNSNINYDSLSQYNILKLEKNSGPGIARQYGINHSFEPYIMFIDTGDYFFPDIFNSIIKEINEHPEINVFSWKHQTDHGKVAPETSNHLHGRIYKRDFLIKNNITFCADEGSYTNEDIGFNRICRLLTDFYFINASIYVQVSDENSLTKRNNHEFRYKKQNIGLYFNISHLYRTCENLVPKEKLVQELSTIMGAMQYSVIETAQERPEFISYAWKGAWLFYHNIYTILCKGITPQLYAYFAKTVKKCRNKRGVWVKPIPINISRFLEDLEKYEIVPSWYCINN